MKKTIAMAGAAVVLATFGCTTTNPERDYMADQPPPLVKGDAAPKARKSALPLPTEDKRRVSSEQINDDNLHDSARLLEEEFDREKKALSKAGR